MVDAQLDAIQRNAFKVDFNPLDVPRNRFIIAGDAWQQCRAGRADAARFGILDMHGLWFIAGNVLRDLASLNRMEMLPWDVWGLMAMNDAGLTDERKTLLDRVAALTLAGDDSVRRSPRNLRLRRSSARPASSLQRPAQRAGIDRGLRNSIECGTHRGFRTSLGRGDPCIQCQEEC